MRVWDLATRKLRYRIDQHKDFCGDITISPDGRRLATASRDNTACVWDFATGQPLSSLLTHPDSVFSVRFHPQNDLVATSCRDSQVRIWEWRTGKLACPPLRHDHEVHSATFTPDGRFVISASEDNTARVWEFVTGKPISPPIPLHGSLINLEISPDGRRVVVGGFVEGRLDLVSLDALWDADPFDLHDRSLFAELSAGRSLDATGGLSTLTVAQWHSRWKEFQSRRSPQWALALRREPRLVNVTPTRPPTRPPTASVPAPSAAPSGTLGGVELSAQERWERSAKTSLSHSQCQSSRST